MSKLCSLRSLAAARRLIFISFFALALTNIQSQLAFSDSASTGGTASGNAAGSNNGSTQTTSESSTSSYAESIGRDFAHGHSTSSSHSVVTQNSDGTYNVVNVGTDANANATSSDGDLNANASANQNGDTGSSAAAGGVTSSASNSKDMIRADASASNGSSASAFFKIGRNPFASSYVPNGKTTTKSTKKGMASLSSDDLGNYSFAFARGQQVRVGVGTSTTTGTFSLSNIGSVIQSAMFAEASASFGSVSARARAQIDAAANTATSDARAGGFSEAYASVTSRGNTLVVTIKTSSDSGKCFRSYGRSQGDCVIARKVVHLAMSGKPARKARHH
jgi:hypothetical protein